MEYNYNLGQFPFPDEFAPPSVKEKNPYGLQSAKAMFYSRNRQGFSLFTQENANINALIELAQGRQSTDNIRRMFGFYSDSGSYTQDNQNLAYIDVQVINLATKYINRTVAKLQKYTYKMGLSAADPISIDEAKEYDAKIRAYYELRDYFQSMDQEAQDFFNGINVDLLPELKEELMFNLTPNSKIRKIIDGEKTLELVNKVINDVPQLLRQFDWDQCVLGRGHFHCYLDENKIPRTDWINPKYWGGSYVQNEDFRKQEYAFFIEFLTVNQFRKEAEGKITTEEMANILRSHSWPNTATTWNNLPDQMVNYDGLRYVPVMRYYFLSNDHTKVAKWKNDAGNTMVAVKNWSYNPENSKKKDLEVLPNVVTSVYGGSWVVDSDVTYNYGRKPIPRSNLVNTRLPIITFAANMKEGRYVSLLSQMVEPLTMFNVAWNKVKDVLAKGRLGIMELNLTAFENIALGKGGNQWSAKEAIDFLFQTHVGVSRQQTNPYGQTNGENIRFISTGVALADYFNTMTTCIKIMDELSGATLAETTDLPDRLTSKTMMANVTAGSDAIEYLVNAHKQAYEQVSHMMLLLTQESKRYGTALQGMIPALGKRSVLEHFEVPDDLPYCDYGLSLEREATPEEWAQFYQDIALGIEKGTLNSSDSAFLREIKDMTMARYALANREKINEIKANQMRQQEMQFQQQTAEQASQQKFEIEMAALEQQKNNQAELIALQGKVDEALIIRKAQLEGELQGISKTIDARIEKQKGIDTIVKEAMRSRAERYKADQQHAAKVITAREQSSTSLANTMIQAKAKAQQQKKKPTTTK